MRKYNPLRADHWLVMEQHKCAGCGEVFEEGEVTTLVSVGPGADQEERAKAREGRAYNAVALPAHWACVTGEE